MHPCLGRFVIIFNSSSMTENERKIVEGLINHDEKVTYDFLYTQCKPLLSSVAREVFMEDMDYEEIIDGLYNYLTADKGAILCQFTEKSNKNTIYKWLRITAKSYFQKKKKDALIYLRSKHPLCIENVGESTGKTKKHKKMDVAAMLDMIELERDRLVLEKIDVEGISYDELAAQTGLGKANLYNIRKRALERLKKKARIALSDADVLCAIRCEQYVLDMFGIHKPLFELKRLAEEKGWLRDTGVAIENLGKIAKHYGLTVRTYKSDINMISAAINAEKQVLVAVDGGELIGNPFEEKLEDALVGGIADHCVVVLNYDEEDNKVMLFNPAFGDIPLTVSTETFLDSWEDSGNYTIEVSKKKLS